MSDNLPEWSRPPFEPGNDLAVTHGAYSPARVDPIAETNVARVLADPDLNYLSAPRFRHSLWAWARAEAQIELLVEYIADCASNLSNKRTKAAYDLLERAETRSDKLRTKLGLDPTGYARLMKDLAIARSELPDPVRLLTEMAEKERNDSHHH